MRRVAFFVALVLAAASVDAGAGAAVELSCPNPVHVTGHQGGVSFPGGYRYNQDVWSGVGEQTAEVCDQTDWVAHARQKGAPATGVKAYPASERGYTDWSQCSTQPRLDSFTRLKSSFWHVSPSKGSWDWAYDLFIGSGACDEPLTEIMVFTEVRNVDLPTPQYTDIVVDGVAMDLYWSTFTAGGKYLQFRLDTEATSGTVNFKRIFRWLEDHGLLDRSETLLFLRYGAEILNTGGGWADFQVTKFTVTEERT